MSDLGLNSHHTDVVANYMAFTKLQRVQNLRTIDGLFQDVFDSRLLDSSYTVDEVQDILYSLRKLLKGELESGLMDVNHMNVLLLQQLFSQAENWHLRLEINLSELQNRSLLEVVKEIDLNGFIPKENRLKKLDDPNDPIGLLQLEIKRLEKDLARYEKETKSLNQQIQKMEKELGAKQNDEGQHELIEELHEKIAIFQKKVQELEQKLKDAENNISIKDTQKTSEPTSDDDHELRATREKLIQTQCQLKLAEQELERKFKETTAFLNMKKMLDTKNAQIKLLRNQLKENEDDFEDENSDSSIKNHSCSD
ncbi:leucine zipper transcription factor-like protein 1 [Neocloeon triangulifer]|uniref:leucine zipper transcription factor-like protein 1 n=1 Tax=Neocloeon triangulifer TaxID=2078957 RepID=UPI00286F307C|nr:leucine zipper transcription factor-like protein 1 [Neocloeon triangulifer]